MDDDSLQDPELVSTDDAAIGRAIKWSVVALGVLLVIGLSAWLYSRRAIAPPPTSISKLTALVAPSTSTAGAPVVHFTDITTAAGITFIHNSGAYGEKLLPETMG